MLTEPIGYRGGIKIRVVGVGDCTAKDFLTWLPALCLQEHSKMPKDVYHWSERGISYPCDAVVEAKVNHTV